MIQIENFHILDSLSDSSAVINQDGLIIFVNQAWKNFSKENQGTIAKTDVGVNYLTVCGDDDSPSTKRILAGIQQVIRKEKSIYEIEYPCHSPTEKRWFVLRTTQLSTNPELTLMLHINITKRKLAELSVEKINGRMQIINERLNSALYKIVHDIQNPVNAIIGMVSLIKLKSDDETVKEYLGLIDSSGAYLKSFIQETLKYISLSSDQNELLDFNVILKKYLEAIEPLLRSKSIYIQTNLQQNDKFHSIGAEFHSFKSHQQFHQIF